MVEVYEFNERLDFRSLSKSLFTHSLSDGKGVSLNSSDESVRELFS